MNPGKMPSDAQIEKSVLGCFLLEDEYQQIPRLQPDLFYDHRNREVAKAIMSLSDAGEPYDLSSVTSWLESQGRIQQAGGALAVTGLLDTVVTTASLDHYLNVLEDKALRRAMIEMAMALHQKAMTEEVPADELREAIEAMAERMVSQNHAQQKTMTEVVDEQFPHIAAEFEGDTGLSTGLPVLDRRIKGLTIGSYIIAGRPGSGKTSLALNMMLRQAQAGHRVGFVSIEMTLEMMLAWMLDWMLKRDHSYIPTGGTKVAWIAQIKEMAEAMKSLPIIIDDRSYVDVADVVSSAYRMRFAYGVEAIYIDYMQLLEARQSRDGSREQEVAKISRSLLGLKKKLGIPIITICQINREMTKRGKDDRRPHLEDLRESGSIEQDADVVIMLYDPTHHGEKGMHELHITKNRSGAVTSQNRPIKLQFDKPAKRFDEGVDDGFE